jgi:hypothetical protein
LIPSPEVKTVTVPPSMTHVVCVIGAPFAARWPSLLACGSWFPGSWFPAAIFAALAARSAALGSARSANFVSAFGRR